MILVATPSHSGSFEAPYVGGLFQCAQAQLFQGYKQLNGCADIRLARNLIVDDFLHGNYKDYNSLFFIDSDIGFASQDFQIMIAVSRLTLLVIGEYPKKTEKPEIVKLGLGFCVIHRYLFKALDALNKEDGSAFVDSFMWEGRLVKDYFLSGSMSGRYYTEDAGFFELCRMAEITPKFESMIGLTHTGKKTWVRV